MKKIKLLLTALACFLVLSLICACTVNINTGANESKNEPSSVDNSLPSADSTDTVSSSTSTVPSDTTTSSTPTVPSDTTPSSRPNSTTQSSGQTVPSTVPDIKDDESDDDTTIRLSFKETLSYNYLKSIDGKEITINGYLATSSPVDGSFIFLMNLPYQSCPFCVPNTSELSNTIEVYPESGERFSYTSSAVKVTGTLKVAPQDKPFTDPYGYEFSFKIIDATYEVLTSDDMGEGFGVWEKLSQSGVIDELYKMYDYVDFICKWNEYFVNSYTDANGTSYPGYYLWASDAKNYLEKGNMKYGTKENYFSNLIAKVEAIDKNAFAELVTNIKDAEALAKTAYDKLYKGEYTKETKFVEKFGTTDDIYTIIGGEELKSQLNDVFKGFQEWLGGWEL